MVKLISNILLPPQPFSRQSRFHSHSNEFHLRHKWSAEVQFQCRYRIVVYNFPKKMYSFASTKELHFNSFLKWWGQLSCQRRPSATIDSILAQVKNWEQAFFADPCASGMLRCVSETDLSTTTSTTTTTTTTTKPLPEIVSYSSSIISMR